MKPIFRYLLLMLIGVNVSSQLHAQCDSFALAHDSLQWVVDGPTGSPSVGGTYRMLSSIKKYKDTLYLGGAFSYVGRYTGGSACFDTSTGDYININKWPRVNGIVKAIVDDGSGGVFLLGKFTKAGDSARENVVRVNSSGQVTAFKANTNDTVLCGIVNNGKLYIGGRFTTVNSTTRNYAAAFTVSTGALDNTWNANANGTVTCMETDGSLIYLGGGFSTVGGVSRDGLCAVNTTTGATTSFKHDVNYGLFAMKIYRGRLYVGGWFTVIDGVTRNKLASITLATNTLDAWHPNISSDWIYGPGADVSSIDAANHNIYFGGFFDKVGNTYRSGIAAVDTGTAQLTSWVGRLGGTSLPGTGVVNGFKVRSVKVAGGTVYACGRFTRAVAYVNSTYTNKERIHFVALDTVVGNPTDLAINGYYNKNTDSNYTNAECVNVVGGRLYIGGKFGSIGGHQRRNLAGIDLVNNKVLETFKPEFQYTSYLDDWSYVSKIDVSNDTLYAIGDFDSVNHIERGTSVAFAIGNGYSVTNFSFPQNLNNFKVNDSCIYGVGNFYFTQGGVTHKSIARYNKGTGALYNSWAPTFLTASSGGWPTDFVFTDDMLVLFGAFSYASFNLSGVTHHFPTGNSQWVFANGGIGAGAVSGRKIFGSGAFTDGANAYDTTTDFNNYHVTQFSNWNPNIGFWKPSSQSQSNEAKGVFVLETIKNRVYLGGGFDTVGNRLCGSFAVVDTATGAPLPWKTFLGYRNWRTRPSYAEYVRDIEVAGDTVFIGGDFSDVNGTPMAGLARFHFDNFTEPTVSISANDTTVCANTQVTVTASTSNTGATYVWKKNGSTQTGSNSTFTFTPADGDAITCTITIPSTGCVLYTTLESSPIIFDVTANTTPTMTMSINKDTVCIGDSVHLTTTTNITTASYQWKVGGVNIGANIDTYSYVPANGDVVTCVIKPVSGCYSPDSVKADTTVTVHVDTVTSITITANTNPFCPGDADTLTATTNVSAGVYQWMVNGAAVTGANAATYTYSPADNDQLECIISAPLTGCYDDHEDTSTVLTLTAFTPDTAKITIAAASNPVACEGIADTFTATTNVATGGIYAWKVNGTPSGTNAATYSYVPNDNDVVTCDIIVAASTCYVKDTTASTGITVGVTAPPKFSLQPKTVGLSAGDNAQFDVTTTGTGNTYQWQMNTGGGWTDVTNGGQYSGATTNTLSVNNLTTANNNTKFRCIAYNVACPDTSNEAELLVFPLGIKSVHKDAIAVYPNPVQKTVTVTSTEVMHTVEVMSLVGQKVLQLQPDAKKHTIDMEHLAKGIYIIKVNNKHISRVVKE